MVRAIKILILCLLTVSGFAQVVQERNARGADRIIILKDGFRVPIRDTATAPALLNYSGDSSRGGVVYDSTLQKLCFWTGVRWVCLDDAAGPGGSSQWRDTTNGIYYNQGNVGIGEVNPNYALQVGEISTIVATGGTVSADGNFTRHTFTSSGTFTINQPVQVEYLIVAGGGGGGGGTGGGGGGGGLLKDTLTIAAGSYSIVVGNGGAGGIGTGNNGANGQNSSAFSLTAIGGGGGGRNGIVGNSGGSGGGGSFGAGGGAGTAGQGFAGGSGVGGSSFSCGGGGGASALGGNVTGSIGGTGGAGAEWPTGSGVYYAGGGGGGTFGGTHGTGGIGGGANANASAAANTGGGGGGGIQNTNGGNGGSGVVIIRYLGIEKKSAYVNDSTITSVLKISNIAIQAKQNLNPIGADANGNVFKAIGWTENDSLAFQKRGRNQRINTVGWQSGYNGFVGASSAAAAADSSNFIWGIRAGNALTTGYRNIAMGRGALKTATTGHSLIAIGDSAMANGAVTQQGAIAIGQRALAAYVGTGALSQGAIAIGQNAGAAFTGAQSSTILAIGRNAAQSWANATGAIHHVLAIGSLALSGTAGGTSNFTEAIAIGYNALSNGSMTGSRNIAIGHNAGTTITTGSDNLILYTSGTQNLTTGQRNVFLNSAGTGISTSNENMIIGTTARNFGNDGNQVHIGAANEIAFTVGNKTVSIGSFANRATGNFNTAIGFAALRTSVTAGIHGADTSTAIGYEAGANGSNQGMARQKGIYIGYRAGYAGVNFVTATGRELIAIGLESAQTQTAGDHNTAIGRVNLANTTGSNQLAIGGNGIGWIRQDVVDGSLRRTLINATLADVTTFTTSAALEINGTNGAVLLPRLTTAQRDALTATNGMILYNTTTDKIQAYAAGAWVDLH